MQGSFVIRRNKILQDLLKSVIYNKHDILAINKPYGLPIQGNSNTSISLNSLLEDFAKVNGMTNVPKLAHRLDRDCTGVLLLTKSDQAAKFLGEAFRERKVDKRYWCVAIGCPTNNEGEITVALKEREINGRFKISLYEDSSQEKLTTTKTKYRVLAQNKNTCSLLEVQPESGHKHQIRVHLAQGLGLPVLGDHKYSSDRQEPQIIPLRLLQLLGFKGVPNTHTGKRKIQAWQRASIPLHLHAKEIHFKGLDSKPVIIRAPLPEFFSDTLSCLRLDPLRTEQKRSKIEKQYSELKQIGISTSIASGF